MVTMTNELGKDMVKKGEGQQAELNRLLTSKDICRWLKVSESHLANQRWLGTGINWVKIGGSVRYREIDVLKYIEENIVNVNLIRREK